MHCTLANYAIENNVHKEDIGVSSMTECNVTHGGYWQSQHSEDAISFVFTKEDVTNLLELDGSQLPPPHTRC